MRSIDQEWRELTEIYSQMSEGELQALADEAYDLTDTAREVLRAEISRRGLGMKMKLRDEPALAESAEDVTRASEFDPTELDLLPFGRVFDLEEARRIKSIFNNGGVLSYFGPNHVEDVEELKAPFDAQKSESLRRGFEAGIEYSVPRKYRDQASRVLANAPQEPTVDTDSTKEADYVAMCPRCRDSNITFEGFATNSGVGPVADSKYKWICEACGYRWKDDGIEQGGE